MIKQIIFDMDGTLYSSEPMIMKAYERGITKFNDQYNQTVPFPDFELLMSLLGYPVNQIYTTLFPQLPTDDLELLKEKIGQEMYNSIERKEGLLFDGVVEVIHQLADKGYDLFIASNGAMPYLESILNTYQLSEFFHPIITLDYISICDKGDILLEYEKKNLIQSDTSVMVGDRDSDWSAAKKMGCRFIACNYGHGEESEIQSAKIVISSIKELVPLILSDNHH